MTDQPQQTKSNDHRYYPEDEIELMDYLLVIWKWKYLILAGTLAFSLAAAVISFAMPKKPSRYLVEMVLQTEVEKVDENGNKTYIISPQDIKYKLPDYINKSRNTNLSNSANFTVSIINHSDLLNVSCEALNADEGIKKLNFLYKVLLTESAEIIKSHLKKYDDDIRQKQMYLKSLKAKEVRIKKKNEESVKLNEINLKDLIAQKVETNKKIGKIKNDLEKINEKNKFISDKIEKMVKKYSGSSIDRKQNNNFSDLQYDNVLLKWLEIENSYRRQIHDILSVKESAENAMKIINKQIKDISNEIEKIEKGKNDHQMVAILHPELFETRMQIEDALVTINKLETKKNSIKGIQILQPANVKQLLEEKSKTKSMVIIMSFMGLFFMIFLAFFLDYYKKYRRRTQL